MRLLGLLIGLAMFTWGLVSLVPEFFILVYTKGALMEVLFATRSLLANPLVTATVIAIAGLLLIFQSLRGFASPKGGRPPLN